MRSLSRKHAVLAAAALGHSLGVLAVALGLRCAGEGYVLTTIALYLPRWPLGLPIPVLAFALAWRRLYRLLALEVLAGLCWLVPLLGLRVGVARAPQPGRPALRVLSFNIASNASSPLLVAGVRAASADIIALQEAGDEGADYWTSRFPGYEWVVRGQFVLGSRFPILEVSRPFERGAAFVRYRVQLPDGPVHFYSVHPPSPRLAMRRLLAKGVLVDRERLTRIGGSILANADDRARQLRVVVDDARRSALPVIIAGDTNLPELSMVLARTFAGFQDAFGEVGSGFGYTFPANRRRLGPWMRIDRIFVSQALRVLDFTTLSPAGSDHLPVLAVLQRSP